MFLNIFFKKCVISQQLTSYGLEEVTTNVDKEGSPLWYRILDTKYKFIFSKIIIKNIFELI